MGLHYRHEDMNRLWLRMARSAKGNISRAFLWTVMATLILSVSGVMWKCGTTECLSANGVRYKIISLINRKTKCKDRIARNKENCIDMGIL